MLSKGAAAREIVTWSAGTERAKPLPLSVLPLATGRTMRSRPQALTMRRRVCCWLASNMESSARARWASAMGVSRKKVDRMLSEEHCEQAPIRVDDLLYLPQSLRELLWLVMEQWAGEIERGEL